MDLKDAVSEYATLLIDVADFARYNLDCDTARDAAVSDQLHGGEEKRPTQAAKDRARASEPPMPHGDMNIELALLCAVGGEHDPFEEVWSRLPDRVRDGIERRHGEFVAACASGDWRKVETCAECLTTDLLEMANADEQKDADRKLIVEMHEGVTYLVREQKRKSDKARKTGRANQRKGEKNGNGRMRDHRIELAVNNVFAEKDKHPSKSFAKLCKEALGKEQYQNYDGSPIMKVGYLQKLVSRRNVARSAKMKQ